MRKGTGQSQARPCSGGELFNGGLYVCVDATVFCRILVFYVYVAVLSTMVSLAWLICASPALFRL